MTDTAQTPVATIAPDGMADYIRDKLDERVLATDVTYEQLTVTVQPDALPDAAQLCKEDPDLAFDFFDFLCGVDEREEGFAVIVHLYSTQHRHHITLRVLAPGGREEPRVPSLTGVYRGANWHERETYDMFGIVFDGHPGLLPRILTVENFEGWPLRKEFLLSTREAKPWPGSKEPAEQKTEEKGEAAELQSEAPKSAEQKADEAKERAEKARQKAAEMRAKKAAERREGGGSEPDQSDAQAEAARDTGGGDTEDAAAGSVAGDTAAGAPGDRAGSDEPVHDPEAEARAGEGAAPAPSGTPGIEEEGRKGGAEVQTGERPAAETPGMDAEPGREGAAARDARETPAPPPTEPAPPYPRPHPEQAPVKGLEDEVDTVIEGPTEADRPTSPGPPRVSDRHEPPPPPSAGSGTDADERREEGSE